MRYKNKPKLGSCPFKTSHGIDSTYKTKLEPHRRNVCQRKLKQSMLEAACYRQKIDCMFPASGVLGLYKKPTKENGVQMEGKRYPVKKSSGLVSKSQSLIHFLEKQIFHRNVCQSKTKQLAKLDTSWLPTESIKHSEAAIDLFEKTPVRTFLLEEAAFLHHMIVFFQLPVCVNLTTDKIFNQIVLHKLLSKVLIISEYIVNLIL